MILTEQKIDHLYVKVTLSLDFFISMQGFYLVENLFECLNLSVVEFDLINNYLNCFGLLLLMS